MMDPGRNGLDPNLSDSVDRHDDNLSLKASSTGIPFLVVDSNGDAPSKLAPESEVKIGRIQRTTATNENGKFVCTFADCDELEKEFDRKSEWGYVDFKP